MSSSVLSIQPQEVIFKDDLNTTLPKSGSEVPALDFVPALGSISPTSDPSTQKPTEEKAQVGTPATEEPPKETMIPSFNPQTPPEPITVTIEKPINKPTAESRHETEPVLQNIHHTAKIGQIKNLSNVAQECASNGDYNEAIRFYRKIIELNDKNVAAWIAMGHCYTLIGQDYNALVTYQQALKSIPASQKDEQLWYGIGILYKKSGDWTNAEISFRNALRLDPNNALKGEILYNLALVMKEKGELGEAVKFFNRCVLTGVFPPDETVEILYQSGRLQEKMSDIEGALKAYELGLVIQNNNPKLLICAGWAFFLLDKPTQALECLMKAENVAPNNHKVAFMIGRCYLRVKKHTTAYNYFHKCITELPENATYWGSLGILFGELEQTKQSYDCFSKALKFEPQVPEHYYNLGCLFETLQQNDDALTMYVQALDVAPSFQQALVRKHQLQHGIVPEIKFKHPTFTFEFEIKTRKEQPRFSFFSPSSRRENQEPPVLKKIENSEPAFQVGSIERVRERPHYIPREEPRTPQKMTDFELLLASKQMKQNSLPNKLPNENALGNKISVKLPSFSQHSFEPEFQQNKFKHFMPEQRVPSPKNVPVLSLQSYEGIPLSQFSKTFKSSDFDQLGPLIPHKNSTQDSMDAYADNSVEVLNHLNALQTLIKQANGSQGLPGSIHFENPNDKLKPKRNISSPIVLKHNPHFMMTHKPEEVMSGFKRPLPDFRGKIKNFSDEEEAVSLKKVKLNRF